MSFLAKLVEPLVPWWGRLALVAAAVVFSAGAGAMLWHKHVDGPRYDALELAGKAFRDKVAAAGAKQAAETKAKDLFNEQARKEADDVYQTTLRARADSWARERAGLERVRGNSGASTGIVSEVAVDAGLSLDPAGRLAVSAAVSDFVRGARDALEECRAAAREFRDRSALELERADAGATALTCGATWAKKISTP